MTTVCRRRAAGTLQTRTMPIWVRRWAAAGTNPLRLRGRSTGTSGSAAARDPNLSAAHYSSHRLLYILALALSLSGGRPVPSVLAQTAHLRADAISFRSGSSSFEWRGISAFRLVEMAAHGRDRDVIRFLDWARSQQLTVVRVFVMARHLFQL